MKKIIKYCCYTLLVGVILYYSHKRVYYAGWHRGGKVILDYVSDSLKIEVNKKQAIKKLNDSH